MKPTTIFKTTILSLLLLFCVYQTYKVYVKSNKELSPDYFRGIVIDKGVSGGKCEYRWVIADWYTVDGKHIGTKEINASGRPINLITPGGVIFASGTNMKGFFWFNCAGGSAYYPSQITPLEIVCAIITQLLLYCLLIWLFLCFYWFLQKKERKHEV